MSGMRSVLMIVALFAASFLAVRWVTLGAPIPGLHVVRIVPLEPNARIEGFAERSRRDIAAAGEREWLESKTAQGDSDPERTKLREALIVAATAFTGSPCNAEFHKQYLAAATAYARAFMTLRGCPKYPSSCPGSDAELELANRTFRTPADGRVKEAIRAVHEMGIGAKDYPDRLGMVLTHLSDSGGGMGGEFSCAAVHVAAGPKPSDEPPTYRAAMPSVPPRRSAVTPTRQDIDRETRGRTRDAALQALRRPGPALCGPVERGNFVATINQYYSMRDTSQHGYAQRSRAEQTEVERAWSTPVDQQIDGLVREFFVAGYLRPGDLRTSMTVGRVLSGLTWTGRACADKG
jgi:hypothetical protein